MTQQRICQTFYTDTKRKFYNIVLNFHVKKIYITMKLLYIENAEWEYHFIINDLLSDVQNLEIEVFNKDNFKSLSQRNDLIHNNILVVNIVLDVNTIVEVVKDIKPIIIIYCSDEHGWFPESTIFDKYAKLVFRQYNSAIFSYSNNNYQLPLGYAKNFLNGKKYSEIKVKKIDEREFDCSFIGSLKSDRFDMLSMFNKYMEKTNIIVVDNTWNIDTLAYSPSACFDIYNNSIFVICGRGNSSLDCFRIYEGIVSGAIPVIVGTQDEIKRTFNYGNNIPPLLYFDDWESAAINCNNLLTDIPKLQNIQDRIRTWYNDIMVHYRDLVTREVSHNSNI